MRWTWFRDVVLGVLVATLVVPAGELRALGESQQQEEKNKQEKKQEPPGGYTISVEVPVVSVDVVVTTSSGEFIPGLKKENFRVLEDGVPQTITNFASTEAPITIVMLMEFSHLAWGIFAYTARYWAYGFLKNLNADDWVALVTFDLRPHIEVDFTRNKDEVREAIAREMMPGFSEANLYDAVLDTLDRLQEVKGKKAILLIASGRDTFSKHTLDDTLKRLKESDVTIFSIGVSRNLIEYLDARGRLGPITRMDFLQAQNQLTTFARMTGGQAWFPRFDGELPDIFHEVATMLRNQYSLAYTPSNRARDGKYRKIKVELVSPEGSPLVVVDQKHKKLKYVIHAREGYLAPKGSVGD